MATASRHELNKRLHAVTDLNEVIGYFCGNIAKEQKTRFMGRNCMVIGDATRFAKVTVEGRHQWTTLRVEVFVDEKPLTVYTVRFNSLEHAPSRDEWNNPTIGGGHVWRGTGNNLEWYNWRPRAERIEREITGICEFHKCLFAL